MRTSNFLFAALAMIILSTASCKKDCPYGSAWDAYAQNPNGGTGACVATTPQQTPPCTTCPGGGGGDGGGGNGGGGGTMPAIFNPNAYVPTFTEFSALGTVINNPYEQFAATPILTDFANRKAHTRDYAVTPDKDRNTFVDPGTANTGVDKGQITIWTLTEYGAAETVVEANKAKNYVVGSSVRVYYSIDLTAPYAVAVDPHTIAAGRTMASFTGATPFYAKI